VRQAAARPLTGETFAATVAAPERELSRQAP
jgi:hypothetical protein